MINNDLDIKKAIEKTKFGFVETVPFAESPSYLTEGLACRVIKIPKLLTQSGGRRINFLVSASGGASAESYGMALLSVKTYVMGGTTHYCVATLSNLVKGWDVYLEDDSTHWYITVKTNAYFGYLSFYFLHGRRSLAEKTSAKYTTTVPVSTKLVVPVDPYMVKQNLVYQNGWVAKVGQDNLFTVEGRRVTVQLSCESGTVSNGLTIANIPAPYRPATVSVAPAVSYNGTTYFPCTVTIFSGGNIQINGVQGNNGLWSELTYTL